ncbi:glycoside hydrolase family 95 protein [Asticcacaulis solisilvae]|uniref:glycoside hydrolase family 95 protein n=1 Tax=Asticcacaulis solisilvae TaxID=1217274 RepID=UPI003FD8CFA4
MPTLNRRAALKVAAAAGLIGVPAAVRAETPPSPLTLWYKQPASVWTEALPIGNGRLGAMVHGGITREEIQLNEDTLWAGGPYDPVHKGAVQNLAEVRRLIFAGKYPEAEALIEKGMMAQPERQMSYQTVGSLWLTTGVSSMVGGYRRELDLDRAVATTTYSQNGATFTREAFVSPVDQVLVVRLSADKPGRINLHCEYDTPQRAGTGLDGGQLLLKGYNSSQQGIDAALTYEARLMTRRSGGTETSGPGDIVITGADEVVLLVAMATSFKSWNDVSGDPAALNRAVLQKAAAKSYGQLLGDHVAEHQRLFRRVSVDLGTTDAAADPTNERISKSQTRDDPALTALYYQFGRYLLICCSRPGTQAAGLQGIWNDKLNAPWGGKYTININTEMNYWLAEPANLSECVLPLVDLVKDIAKRGEETAREHYGARGWVCHHNTDIWRATGPIDAAKYGTWPMGGAWLSTHLWDHYLYTNDPAYLAEIYPILKGASQFYLDFLTPEPKHGWLVTCPSMSPEHTHPFGTMICAGPTMDTQLLNDLFDITVKAAAALKTDKAFVKQVQATRAKLPPMQIGSQGQLQEWLEDWDMTAVDLNHRHVSHLYGLFPSYQINVRDTPQLAAAAKKSLEIRGDQATGWGTAWRINLWARLGDGDHAHEIMRFLLGPERTYPNMFDAHPPFQIDGNFGGANAVMEMLLQAWDGNLAVLPALPSAWPAGSISGLRVRGGIGADLAWQGGQLKSLKLTPDRDGSLSLRHGNATLKLDLKAGRAVTVGYAGGRLQIV